MKCINTTMIQWNGLIYIHISYSNLFESKKNPHFWSIKPAVSDKNKIGGYESASKTIPRNVDPKVQRYCSLSSALSFNFRWFQWVIFLLFVPFRLRSCDCGRSLGFDEHCWLFLTPVAIFNFTRCFLYHHWFWSWNYAHINMNKNNTCR